MGCPVALSSARIFRIFHILCGRQPPHLPFDEDFLHVVVTRPVVVSQLGQLAALLADRTRVERHFIAGFVAELAVHGIATHCGDGTDDDPPEFAIVIAAELW